MKKTSVILATVLVVALLLQAVSFAWISDNGLSSLVNITGNVHKNYFAYGEGSEDAPYGIATPVQLYYFAWLQYLGFFNVDLDGVEGMDTYYFELADDLDMTGYKLPPIGTTTKPFLGTFNGKGHTISNLTVKNDYGTLSAPPNGTENFGGAEIIGFFGVIGKLEGDTSYEYDTEANQISNFVLENITVETQTSNALIGMIAGYVNGLVDKVGVVGSTVTIAKGSPLTDITNNMSDYGLIGYCTEGFKEKVLTTSIDIYDPKTDSYEVIPPTTGGGDGQGWGGSVAMNTMFTMLKTIRDSNNYSTNGTSYIYQRTDLIIDGKTITLSRDTTTKRTYYDANFGSLVFSPYTNTNNNPNYNQNFNYLTGSTRVTLYECKVIGTDYGYYITNGTNYLTVTGSYPNVSITNTTSQGNAVVWRFSNGANGGTAYTVVGGYMYYLCLGTNNALTLYRADESATKTSWSVSNDGLYSGTRYIDYVGNAWTTRTLDTTTGKKISDGKGNYLTVTVANNRATLTNTKDESAAVAWTFSNSTNNSGTISTQVNGTTYYLRGSNNGSLSAANNSTTWNYDSTNRRLYYSGNRTYYLYYNDDGWTVNRSEYTALDIKDVDPDTTDTKLVRTAEKVNSYEFTSTFKLDNNESNRYFDANGNPVITTNLANRGITYYPLTFEYNSNGRPETAAGNTGYVISSSYDTTSGAGFPIRSGDIRVSQYSTGTYLTNGRDNPYCMNYMTSSFTQVNSLNGKGLNKYSDCYDDYYSSTNTNCYGIHFMDSVISKDSLVSVDNVTIFGKTYNNYEMPTACIDFNLKEAGFINFFAGTYFDGNNTFFSLHKIERGKDENNPETYNKILSIKEIQYIYGVVKDGKIDFKVPYYYTYKDGTSDPIDPEYASENYQVIFNTDWITDPQSYGTWRTKAAYYFEIPVYAGEYALGSVEGKTGAYLVYLDLAANAQVIERTRVDEMSVTTEQDATIPNGVSILEKAEEGEEYNFEAIKPENSAFISIGSGNAGATLTQNGSVITDSGTGHTAVYVGDGLQLVDKNGNPMTVPITRTITVEQSTYYDYNIVTHYTTVTVIRKITEVQGGKTEVYFTKSVVVTDADGNPAVDVNGNPLSKDEERSYTQQLYPDVKDEMEVTKPEQFTDQLLNMHYVVSNTDDMTLNHSCSVTVDEEGEVTDSIYTLTLNNTGAQEVPVSVTLTAYGASGAGKSMEFVVVGGESDTTLDNNQNEQTVTILVQSTQ